MSDVGLGMVVWVRLIAAVAKESLPDPRWGREWVARHRAREPTRPIAAYPGAPAILGNTPCGRCHEAGGFRRSQRARLSAPDRGRTCRPLLLQKSLAGQLVRTNTKGDDCIARRTTASPTAGCGKRTALLLRGGVAAWRMRNACPGDSVGSCIVSKFSGFRD